MYPTKIPENMQYIFENADYLLSQKDFQTLIEKHTRAKNLKLKNGAIYPGLTQSAVYWLSDAYLKQAPVNKQAFQNTVTRLSQINKPSRYL